MKYLKVFEMWESENEYVLVNIEDLTYNVKRELPKDGPTTSIFKNMAYGQVVAVDGADNPIILFSNGFECLIAKEDVVDNMTPEEIEQFKVEIETNKYNL